MSEVTRQRAGGTAPIVVGRNIATNSLLGLGGILGGFVVQVLTAKYFGASPDLDAFLVAFLLLSFLQSQLQAGGIVASAFIPSFSCALGEGAKEARALFSTAIVATTLLGLCFTATSVALSTNIVRFLGEGLSPESAELALRIFRIFSFLFVPLSLAALLSATLRAEDHYFGAASGPLVINCCITVSLVLLVTHLGIMSYVWGVTLGSLFQLAIVSRPLVTQPTLDLRLVSWRDRHLWVFVKAITVLIVDVFSGLLLLAVERNIASTLAPGTVSQMNYAKSLYTLPLRLVVTPAQVVMFSLFAVHFAAGRTGELKRGSAKAQELLVFLMLPSTLVIMCFSKDIVRLIYERGQFTAQDTAATATLLTFYALSIPALALWWQLRTVSFALQNVALPLAAGVLALCIFYIGNKALLSSLGAPSLPLTWAGAYYAASLVLGFGLAHYYDIPTWRSLAKSLAKLSPAILGAFGCISALQRMSLIPEGPDDASLIIAVRIATYAGAGLATYLVIAWAARVEEVRAISNMSREYFLKLRIRWR